MSSSSSDNHAVERFFDYWFMEFDIGVTVDCPQKILNKSNNGSVTWKPSTTMPTTTKVANARTTTVSAILETTTEYYFNWEAVYFNYLSREDIKLAITAFGGALLIFMIALNRKSNINSSALRLFTNYYLGVLLIKLLFVIYFYLYKTLYWMPLTEKYVLCFQNYRTYEITLPNNIGVYEIYPPRLYQYLTRISVTFDESLKHILPTFLILHRLTTYFACKHPFIYQRYFCFKRLKFCYPIIGITFYIFHFIFRKVTWNLDLLTFQQYGRFYSMFVGISASFLVISHLLITVYSIYVIVSYHKSTKKEMQEFKSFLGFSIWPTFAGIFEQITNNSNNGSLFHFLEQFSSPYTLSMNFFAVVLIDLQPTYTCLLYFIFVPFYRKLILKPFLCLCKRVSNTQVHAIHSSQNVSRNI